MRTVRGLRCGDSSIRMNSFEPSNELLSKELWRGFPRTHIQNGLWAPHQSHFRLCGGGGDGSARFVGHEWGDSRSRMYCTAGKAALPTTGKFIRVSRITLLVLPLRPQEKNCWLVHVRGPNDQQNRSRMRACGSIQCTAVKLNDSRYRIK